MATARNMLPTNDLGTAALSWVRGGLRIDLTLRQTAIITAVADGLCQPTVRHLADFLGVSKPVVTRALNSLSHLMTRNPDPADRRSIFIELTPLGQRTRQAFFG